MRMNTQGGRHVKAKQFLTIIILFTLLLATPIAQADEFRAWWVDAWGAGFKTPSETTAMINYARSCNCNAVIVEMEKAGDAYFSSSYFPWATDATYDSLADILNKAHAQGLEVHAWVCVYRIWTQTAPPPQPNHIVNLHPEWLSENYAGAKYQDTSSFLDPGVPAVQDWLVNAYIEMVQNYNIDGITFDRIRYPGTDWGYNAIAVDRFNFLNGLTGRPNAGNTEWSNWRREQINAFVKKFYCNAMAIRPGLKVGAAVWKTSLTASRDYLQDWDAWMAGHYADYMAPMNYTTDNSAWTANNNDNLLHAHGRHMYVAQDTCSNSDANSNWQVIDARNSGLQGCSLYDYGCRSDMQSVLTNPSTGAYPTFVPPLSMSWKTNPTHGILKGTVTNSSTGQAPVYPVTVSIPATGQSTTTDGTGFFGITDVPPGTYTVVCSGDGFISQNATGVSITAGAVTTRNFSLVPDGAPPVISGVGTSNLQATSVVINWTTDENSTTQVEYGISQSYGNITPENTKLVTNHSIMLYPLTPNTQYYFRVISRDATGATAVSGQYTFTTMGYDIPADIIVDNEDPGCSFVGSWITSSSGTDRWGPNYRYCSGAVSGKKCTWRPDVLSAGKYNAYAWWSQGANRATNAPYKVQWNGGSQTLYVNQQTDGGKWNLLVSSVSFATGTTGYIELSNAGVSSTLNVIADAVRLSFAEDRIPPSAPTGVTASAVSTSRINLSWNASTDNVGVTGYKIYRNGSQVGTSSSTTYSDTGLSTSTSYTYTVAAYDAASNTSEQSTPVARYTLPAAPTSGSVSCNRNTGQWYTAVSFVFTSIDGFGPGTRQFYRVVWNNEATHTWTGGEEQWNSGALEKTCEDSGIYYLHLQSCNGDGVPNGTLDLGPYQFDRTAPIVNTVSDNGMYTDASGQLHAEWNASEGESGIEEYQYAIGTSPENIGSVLDWTSAGTNTSITTTGLNLVANTTYFIGVKAKNGVGLWSDVAVSDGITAATVVNTISEAKTLPNGSAVILKDKVVSADFDTFFYIQEPLAVSGETQYGGIRVNSDSPDQGSKVEVGGIIQIASGERILTEASVSTDGTASLPGPLLLTNLALGGSDLNEYTPGVTDGIGTNNLGLLVKVSGRVIGTPTSQYFVIDDGSVQDGIEVDSSRLSTNLPSEGDYVTVVGISATKQIGSTLYRLVRARGDADVTIYSP